MENTAFQLLDVVVLTKAYANKGVRRGAFGTIVEVFDEENVLVEFADQSGRAYAILDLPVSELLKVWYEPMALAA